MRILKRGPPDGKKQQSNDLKIISRKEIKIMKNKGKLLKKTILSFLLAAAMLCGIIPENATVANAASTSVSLSSLGRIDLGYTCHSGNSYAAVEKHQWNQDTGGAKNGNYAKVIRWYVIEKNRSKKGFVMSQALIWSIAEGRTSEAQLKDVIKQVKENINISPSKSVNHVLAENWQQQEIPEAVNRGCGKAAAHV